MTVRRPRAILFDWDGTLIDSWGAIHRALVDTQEARGVAPWTLAETRDRLQSLRDHFPVLFGSAWRDALDDYRGRYYATHLREIATLAGAEALLDACAALGAPLGVVSNKLGDGLRREADHLGWSGRFAVLVGSGDAPRDKPDPAPARVALAGLGLQPGPDVWLVGDSTVDLACARNAGLCAVLVGGDAAAHAAADERVRRFADCAALTAFVIGLQADMDQTAS